MEYRPNILTNRKLPFTRTGFANFCPSLLQRFDSQQFGRCGVRYVYKHFCKAMNRRCYKCRCYNHLAEFCRTDLSRNRMASSCTMPCKEVQEPSNQEENIEKDYICSIMPFSCVDSLELRKMCKISSNLQTLKTEILQKENHEMKRTIMELQRMIKKYENVHEEPIITRNFDHEEIEKLQKRIEDINLQLQEEKEDNELIISNSEELYRKSLDDITSLSSYISELFLYINPSGRSWQEQNYYQNLKFNCDKCGSKKYHHELHCAALKVEKPCGYCNQKSDHLTVFCKEAAPGLQDVNGEETT